MLKVNGKVWCELCAIPGAFTIINKTQCHLDVLALWIYIVKIAVPFKGQLSVNRQPRVLTTVGGEKYRKT